MKKLLIVLILFFSYTSYSQTVEEYFNSAREKMKNGDHYGAISDYTKVIEINSNDNQAYYFRGSSKYYLNDKRGACADWRKAANLGNTTAQDNIRLACN